MLGAMLETHAEIMENSDEEVRNSSIESDEEAMNVLCSLLEYFIERECDEDEVMNMYCEFVEA